MPGANASRPAQPAGLSGQTTLQGIAEATGGTMFYNINNISPVLRTVLDEADVSYTLGFYPEEKSLDGRTHDLSVKLGKKPETNGATVRHRKKYFASKQPGGGVRVDPNELLTDAADARALSLTAAAVPIPTKPGVYKIDMLMNLAELQLQPRNGKYAGGFDLAVTLEAPNPPRGNFQTFNLDLTDEQVKQALKSGLGFDVELATNGQAGKIRVLVQDRVTGNAGSVRIPVTAR